MKPRRRYDSGDFDIVIRTFGGLSPPPSNKDISILTATALNFNRFYSFPTRFYSFPTRFYSFLHVSTLFYSFHYILTKYESSRQNQIALAYIFHKKSITTKYFNGRKCRGY